MKYGDVIASGGYDPKPELGDDVQFGRKPDELGKVVKVGRNVVEVLVKVKARHLRLIHRAQFHTCRCGQWPVTEYGIECPSCMLDGEYAIELDACEPDSLPLAEGIALKVMKVKGPSGWPVIEVRGERSRVRAYVLKHWGEQIADVLEAHDEYLQGRGVTWA